MSASNPGASETRAPSDAARWDFEVDWRREFMRNVDRQNDLLQRIAVALERMAETCGERE